MVRDLARRVLGYCLLRTGDRSLAEEIAQDALAALVHRWRRHGMPESPEAFVFAIARRRAARVMIRHRLWVPLDRAPGLAAASTNVERRLILQSERSRLLTALGRLKRRDRELLLLITVGNLRLTQAAAVLGVSESAAKMRAQRARKRLRELMEESGGADKRR